MFFLLMGPKLGKEEARLNLRVRNANHGDSVNEVTKLSIKTLYRYCQLLVSSGWDGMEVLFFCYPHKDATKPKATT